MVKFTGKYWPLVLPLLLVISIYGGYWVYLARAQLTGLSAEGEAFMLIGQSLLQERVGENSRFKVGASGISADDDCNFWTFESITTQCRGVNLIAIDFEESDRSTVTEIANHIALGLSRPCTQIENLREVQRNRAHTALGCGTRVFKFRLRVQAHSSNFITNSVGGGHYENHHIYSKNLTGEI